MARWRDETRRYRQYKARKGQLPASHHEAIEAVERYALRCGPTTGEGVLRLLEDLVEVFERSAADGTAVTAVVGRDPLAFAEAFVGRYPAAAWVQGEQLRLTSAVRGASGRASRARVTR